MPTKTELVARRQKLIDAVAAARDTKSRSDLQLQLSETNAEIKRLNKIEAAEAKHAADIKRALGRKESEANEGRREERETRFGSTANALDEEILWRAKQLMRTLEHARRLSPTPLPRHHAEMRDTVTNFVEAQRLHLKQLKDAEEKRDATWRAAWKDDDGKADDNARG